MNNPGNSARLALWCHALDLCAETYGVTREQILGRGRPAQVVLARHMAWLLCRELGGLSLSQLGALTGDRHHGAVHDGIEHARGLIEVYAPDRADYQRLRAALTSGVTAG